MKVHGYVQESRPIQDQILTARAKKIAWDLYQESPHSNARLLGADDHQKNNNI